MPYDEAACIRPGIELAEGISLRAACIVASLTVWNTQAPISVDVFALRFHHLYENDLMVNLYTWHVY